MQGEKPCSEVGGGGSGRKNAADLGGAYKNVHPPADTAFSNNPSTAIFPEKAYKTRFGKDIAKWENM